MNRIKKLKFLFSKYAPEDIFNTDEKALFYKILTEKTLAFKGDKCFGDKIAKPRPWFFFIADDMTEFRKTTSVLFWKVSEAQVFFKMFRNFLLHTMLTPKLR